MKRNRGAALIWVLCLGLSACDLIGKKDAGKEPVGQVVATVNGQEVTLLELRAELGGVAPSDPKLARAAEQAALRAVIGRKVLANAAIERKLDKTPDFALQRLRTMDGLLVQNLQTKIASDVPPPTREEAERFVTDHPDVFAERKIFLVDQIRMARPTDANLQEELKPLKTLEEVDALLTRENILHQRVGSTFMDAIGTDPNIIEQIVKLPAREVFVIPNGQGLLISQIRETRIEPFKGEPAITYALDFLRGQRIQQAVAKEFNAIVMKSATSIQYNKAYQPAPPPAAKPEGQPDATPAANAVPEPVQGPDGERGKGG